MAEVRQRAFPAARPAWLRYGIALVSVTLALAVRAVLPSMDYPFSTFYIAVTVAAWFGGLGPGVVAIVLGFLAGDYFLVPPADQFSLTHFTPSEGLGLVLYLFATGTITFLVTRMRKEQARAEASAKEARNKQEELRHEISERQETERHLRDHERKLQEQAHMLKLAHILVRDPEDRIIYWGQGAEGLYGYRQDEALGRISYELLSTKFPQPLEEIRQQLARDGRWEGELVHRKRDGQQIVVASHWVLHCDGEGNPLATIEAETDITERRRADERQRYLYELVQAVNQAGGLSPVYEAAMEVLTGCLEIRRVGVLFYDSDNIMRFKAWRGLSDSYRRAVEGHSPWQFNQLDPEPVCVGDVAKAGFEKELRTVLEKENIHALAFIPLMHERRVVGKFMLYCEKPHQFTRDEIYLAQTVGSQVAYAVVRQKNEQELRHSQERLNLACAAAKLGIWEWELENGRLEWSAETFVIFGITDPAFVPTMESVERRIHPEDRKHVAERTAESLQQRRAYHTEFRILWPDGQIRWLLNVGRGFDYDQSGGPKRVAGVVMDVTERKEAEEAVRRSEEVLRQAVRVAEVGVFEHNHQEDRITYSAEGRQISGLSKDEEMTLTKLIERIHPEDREMVAAAIQRAHDPSGDGRYAVDCRFVRPDGSERWVSARSQTFFTGEGAGRRPVRTVGAIVDMTERKEMEMELTRSRTALQRYAQELERRVAERTNNLKQTIESLEGVLYHVAHDLRAPLRAMHSFTKLLLEQNQAKLDAMGQDFGRRILAASARMDELIRDLLVFGRLGHQQVAWDSVDLNVLTEKLLRDIRSDLPEQKAEIQIDRPLPVVWGDARVLHQLLANLISNALKFVASGITPRVHIWGEELNGSAWLHIQDNGIGIEPEYQDRIFGIFERLHETDAYPGTGIGLAIVKKGVELLGGKVQLESRPGEGSRFTLVLKAAGTPATSKMPADAVQKD